MLSDLTQPFPDLVPLRGLLAILSLPQQDIQAEKTTEEEASDSAENALEVPTASRSSSPNIAAQMAPFLQRMKKGASPEGTGHMALLPLSILLYRLCDLSLSLHSCFRGVAGTG